MTMVRARSRGLNKVEEAQPDVQGTSGPRAWVIISSERPPNPENTAYVHRILRSTGVPVPRYLGRFQRSHRLLYHNFQG